MLNQEKNVTSRVKFAIIHLIIINIHLISQDEWFYYE